MARFVVQALIVISATVLAVLVAGAQVYLIVAVIVAIMVCGLMVAASRASALAAEGLDESKEPGGSAYGRAWYLYSALYSCLIGAFWPTLPIVFAWRGVLKRDDP